MDWVFWSNFMFGGCVFGVVAMAAQDYLGKLKSKNRINRRLAAIKNAK